MNSQHWTPRTQRLVEQTNGIIENKLSKKIEATRNPKWSEYLIRVALAMNTQRHSSLFYNLIPLEVFLVASIGIMIMGQQRRLKLALSLSILQMNG